MAENETINQSVPQRTKYPQLASTPIGRINVRRQDGSFDVYTVDYGNIIDPITDNKPIFLSTNQYIKMMDAFYQSKSGSEYVIYSEDKLIEDYLKVRKIIEANCAAARQKEAEAAAQQAQERAADEQYVVDNLYEKDRRVRKLIDDKRAKEQKAAEQQNASSNAPMQSQTLTGEAAEKAALKRAKMLNANGIPADAPAVEKSVGPQPVQKSEAQKIEPQPSEAPAAPVQSEHSKAEAANAETPIAEPLQQDHAVQDVQEPVETDEDIDASDENEEPAEETPVKTSRWKKVGKAKKVEAPAKPVREKPAAPVKTAEPAVSAAPVTVASEHLKPLLIAMLVFEILIVLLLACILVVDAVGLPVIYTWLGLA